MKMEMQANSSAAMWAVGLKGLQEREKAARWETESRGSCELTLPVRLLSQVDIVHY